MMMRNVATLFSIEACALSLSSPIFRSLEQSVRIKTLHNRIIEQDRLIEHNRADIKLEKKKTQIVSYFLLKFGVLLYTYNDS